MSPWVTVSFVLAILALVIAIASAATKDKVPLWVAVVLVSIIALLHTIPK